MIACDSIVGAAKYTLTVMQQGRTYVALNTHGTPTAGFVKNADWQFPGGNCETVIAASVGAGMVGAFDAEQVAVQMLGDSIYTNPLMLGYAWQQGRVPLSLASLMRAIELNGVQVDNNKAAFEWGRRCAHDLASVQAMFKAGQVIEFVRKPSLDEMVGKRVDFLTDYQDAAYAQRYRAFVDKVRAAEAPLATTKLTEAVARYLFKLMAYKDEYEVARLHTDRRSPTRSRDVRGRLQARCTTSRRRGGQDQRPRRTGQAAVRSVGAQRIRRAGKDEGSARHRVRPVWPQRRTPHRTRADHRIPRYRRRTADGLDKATSTSRPRSPAFPKRSAATVTSRQRHLAAVRPKWEAQMQRWRAGALRAAA